MIRATEADRPAIEAFLSQRIEQAMFPLSNLVNHGMGGDHPFSMRFWISRGSAGVEGTLGVTAGGMVMPNLPKGDHARAARALAGLDLTGLVGPLADVSGLRAAADLGKAPCQLDEEETQYNLSLDDLILPEGPGELFRLGDAPAGVIRDWMTQYQQHTLMAPPDEARQRGENAYERAMERGNFRVLMAGDVPLALSGFNAQVADAVQLGGIFTPPDLRGRGHARRAVALHLAEARRSGARKATLFTRSAAAARADRAIGFRPAGGWSLVLFSSAQRGKSDWA